MRYHGPLPKQLVTRMNGWVRSLRSSRQLGPLVRRHITTVTYVGRRSGSTFSTPVGYRRRGDVVTIGVQLPAAKTWWRNFLDGGGQLTLDLDGVDRTGHAVATKDDGRVTVAVQLDPVTEPTDATT